MVAGSPPSALRSRGAFIGEVTLVPADPPRESCFALWRPVPGFGEPGGLRLVIAAGAGVSCEEQAAAFVPMRAAIPWLAGGRAQGTRSLLAWRAVIRAGLALVAKGQLRPWISPRGYDAWQTGPLGEDDEALLRLLAAALPAEAHALPIEGDSDRIMSPELAVRTCWDAIADALPRTAAAAVAFGGPLYSDWVPRRAGHLAPALWPGAGEKPEVVRLRLELPANALPRLICEPMSYAGRVALH